MQESQENKYDVRNTSKTIINPKGIEIKQPIPNIEEVRKSQELLKNKN